MNAASTSTIRQPIVGRLAPSPTGRMHAGNIFSSLMSWLYVRAQGGTVVLRIDDLDVERSKPLLAYQAQKDYEFLGLTWDKGPFYQQGRMEAYQEALRKLDNANLIYPCFCSRADLHAASAPHTGEKVVYAGTCRHLSAEEVQARQREKRGALRVKVPERYYGFYDLIQGFYGQNLAQECGDFIVRRSDGLFAYQLACVLDDADEDVNFIVRGVDLLSSTPQQRFLQEALGLPLAHYAHVPLLVAAPGRRLSKRDHDASLDEMCAVYGSAEGVIGHIAYVTGLSHFDEPASPEELLRDFDATRVADCFSDKIQIPWSLTGSSR